MKQLMLMILAVLALNGCITRSYYRSNEQLRNPAREFDSGFGPSFRVFKGVNAGVREIGGERFHVLGFSGPLKGENRFLRVMVPVKGRLSPAAEVAAGGMVKESKRLIQRPGNIIITEEGKEEGDAPAYLLVRFAVNLKGQQRNPFHYLKAGEISDPGEVFRYFGIQETDIRYPLAMVELDFSNTMKYIARAAVWERGPGEMGTVRSLGVDIDSFDGPRLKVQWQERSRLVYGLRQAGYAGTVIADAVTAPVQLVMLLIYGLSGPVR
ncbi:MAG: hypothetical protein JXA20_09820 [Spirochaetes bacterium]|nr:hypothetical protein [Spirochaetota bacterium]